MFAKLPDQGSLFGGEEVSFDRRFANLSRVDLDGEAWLDYCPVWLQGDETLFETLTDSAEWSQPVVKMYDREVLTPRLVAKIDPGSHSVIPEMIEALSARYGRRLDQVSAGWYRDGNDSVAFHGDRIARERAEAAVATVSLGGARRFLIRPKSGGESRSFSLGHGDLMVMGGSCQRTWEHGIPKTKSAAEPRIALMFRHRYD
ncbi:MAG: alpha-ketoglutarate-dependent dioxygenase AlkB [Acidimicrobiia bacterium]